MPPIPDWNSLHPLVVHFPIGLLLTAPIFIILALVSKAHWRALGIGALLMLALGIGGIVLAAATGEDAAESVESAASAIAGAAPAVHDHEEAGELARNIFLGIGGAYAVILALSCVRLGRTFFVVASAALLIGYAAGAVVLANAAHQGGVLVHTYGLHANLGPATAPPATPGAARPHDDD